MKMSYNESCCTSSGYGSKSKSIDSEDDVLFGMKKSEQSAQFSSAQHGQSWKHGFTFDLLLIYDASTDYHNVQDLLPHIDQQNLRILDFARDRPPGVNDSAFLTDALKECKYTCIVVTRNFLSNMWLRFRTDMAIQDMLQNENKRYTVVVVVMDLSLQQKDIPLDLQTLSPIFQTERYFKNRISRAFFGMPFGSQGNSAQKSSLGSFHDSHCPTLPQHPSDSHLYSKINNDCSSSAYSPSKQPGESFHFSDNGFIGLQSKPSISSPYRHEDWLSNKKVIEQNYPSPQKIDRNRNHVDPQFPTSQATPDCSRSTNDVHSFSDPESGSSAENGFKKHLHEEPRLCIKSSSDTSIMSRAPREHADTPSSHPLTSADFQRLVSVTKKSNGLRQPIETDDKSNFAASSPMHCQSPVVTSLPHTVFPGSMDPNRYRNPSSVGQAQSYVGDNSSGYFYNSEPTTFHFSSNSLGINIATPSTTQLSSRTSPTLGQSNPNQASSSYHHDYFATASFPSQMNHHRGSPTNLPADHFRRSSTAPETSQMNPQRRSPTSFSLPVGHSPTRSTSSEMFHRQPSPNLGGSDYYTTISLIQEQGSPVRSSSVPSPIHQLSASPMRQTGYLQSVSHHREETNSVPTVPIVTVSNLQLSSPAISTERFQTSANAGQASPARHLANTGPPPVLHNLSEISTAHMTDSYDSIEGIEVEISDEEMPRVKPSLDENASTSRSRSDQSRDTSPINAEEQRSLESPSFLRSIGKSFVERFKRKNR